MLFRYRLPVMVAGLFVLAVSVFVSVDWLWFGQDEQELTHDISLQALATNENSVHYRLVPESIMTGLCWRSADGSRQGLFKDITDGIMQWRETVPGTQDHNSSATSPSRVGELPDKQQLLRQLKQLSFQPADFIFTDQTAKISGILTFANHSSNIILDLDRPTDRELAHEHKIEVTASTALSRYQPQLDLYAQQYNIDMCLNMQAESADMLSALVQDQPG